MSQYRRFKFGNQVHAHSLIHWSRATLRFARSIMRDGYRPNSDLVRYFFFQTFHDGPIIIDNVDLAKGTVEFIFRNVSALDRMTVEATREDFMTRVTFQGVTELEIRNVMQRFEGTFEFCEFWREGTNTRIVIYAWQPNDNIARFRIAFRDVRVEDISDRLTKYLPIKVVRSKVLELGQIDLQVFIQARLEFLKRHSKRGGTA